MAVAVSRINTISVGKNSPIVITAGSPYTVVLVLILTMRMLTVTLSFKTQLSADNMCTPCVVGRL